MAFVQNSTECLVCGAKHSSSRGLAFHVKVHGLNSETYCEQLFNQNPKCACSKPAVFLGLGLGYRDKCNHCNRSKSAIDSKERLKKNPEKFKNFRERTAKGMVGVWAERDKNGISVKDVCPTFLGGRFIGNFYSADNILEDQITENLEEFFQMEHS